ncbi:hypothetical protein ENSA7_05300 [Enhygromyxa salina]|uniref:Uncharacterized protein n=1 Tax=Enhygromyxa salina TaxID=215803 RepID=A0A2S9YXF0_9BACT|nr:hypothetical protein ENSA7_05300 [Enhygromyxa salina]
MRGDGRVRVRSMVWPLMGISTLRVVRTRALFTLDARDQQQGRGRVRQDVGDLLGAGTGEGSSQAGAGRSGPGATRPTGSRQTPARTRVTAGRPATRDRQGSARGRAGRRRQARTQPRARPRSSDPRAALANCFQLNQAFSPGRGRSLSSIEGVRYSPCGCQRRSQQRPTRHARAASWRWRAERRPRPAGGCDRLGAGRPMPRVPLGVTAYLLAKDPQGGRQLSAQHRVWACDRRRRWTWQRRCVRGAR